MTTATIQHNGLEFQIRVVSLPNAHIATIYGVGSDYRRTMRDMPSVRLALEVAQIHIERTF